MMTTVQLSKWGEASATHHLEEEWWIAMGGNTVDKEESNREQTKQRRALMCFVPPLAKKMDVIFWKEWG
jgi:hypothetical protein